MKTHIEESIGTWNDRQAFTAECAEILHRLLKSLGWNAQLAPMTGNDSRDGEAVHLKDEKEILIQYRAKTNESIQNKLDRFGESLDEMLDLYGLRVVASSINACEKIAEIVTKEFEETPSDSDMTIRGGTLLFPPLRDYRKRDWPGASPATANGYLEAIHLNRRIQNRIVELQIMTLDLFQRYCTSTSEESHAAFKQRQAALHSSTSQASQKSLD